MPSTETQAELLAGKLIMEGYQQIGVICVNNEFGKLTYEQFKKRYQGRIVLEECPQQGETEFRSILAKVKISGAQALLLSSYPVDSGLIVRQVREMNLTIPIYGFETLGHKVAKDTAREAIEGVYYAYPTTNTESEFKRRFTERYNNEPEFGADTAYDALELIIKSIQRCGTGGQQLRDCLYIIGDRYNGVSGEITFDKKGDVHRPATLYQIRNMTAVEVTH